MKNTLVTLPSGTIDLVIKQEKDNAGMYLQFNTSCEDALPYCKAMCCRIQSVYSAQMTSEEAKKFGCRTFETQDKDILIMPTKNSPVQNECRHLKENHLCGVHATKPATCRSWHCSPQGKGDGVTVFAQGWLLLPTQK